MVWEGVPYFVNGAEHSAEVMRLLAYAAIKGGEGVIGPSDCKVTANSIPNDTIHIAPGAVAMLNQSPGGSSQGYLARNVGDEVRALDPQGSSGIRYDLVALVVEDPQYPGQPAPASVAAGPYPKTVVYKDVPASTRRLAQVDADQTGYALALVKFDASDGTVTTADILDLRQMLFSREQSLKFIMVGDGIVNLNAGLDVSPPGSSWQINVPTWASRAVIEARWAGVRMTDTGGGDGGATGKARVDLGVVQSSTTQWQADATGINRRVTQSMLAAIDADVTALAGTQVSLRALLSKDGGTGMTAATSSYTTVVVEVTFKEVLA